MKGNLRKKLRMSSDMVEGERAREGCWEGKESKERDVEKKGMKGWLGCKRRRECSNIRGGLG